LTLAYLDNGELEKARKLLQDRRPLFSQNYLWRGLWALVLASAGDHEQALQALDEETLKFAAAAFPSTNIVAESYALLGETSRAIEWLERTVRNGDERTEGFRKSPRLASIRNDPRFQQIIDSVESRRINKGEKAHAVDK
jgi:tetratricopeptide (TPR) repeat protein